MGKSGRGRRTFLNVSPYSKLRGDYLKISEAIGQVMVINGEDALPSSSVNNAPEEPRKEELGILGVEGNDVKRIGREESNKEFMNAMKQAKINGEASSQVPTFRFPIMDEPPLRMQRTPAPYFMNGQSERPRKRFAYESPIEELYYDRSVVPMEKPLENI